MKTSDEHPEVDMLESYDFTDGISGKYIDRLREGSNLVVLDPDVAKIFPDAQSVNHALRALAAIIADRRKTVAGTS